jgi:hypothetical protein
VETLNSKAHYELSPSLRLASKAAFLWAVVYAVFGALYLPRAAAGLVGEPLSKYIAVWLFQVGCFGYLAHGLGRAKRAAGFIAILVCGARLVAFIRTPGRISVSGAVIGALILFLVGRHWRELK